MDQADIINSTMTTDRAGQPIERHMLMMSNPTTPSSWNKNKHKVISFASTMMVCVLLLGFGIRRLLGQREVHVNLRHHFNRVTVKQGRLITPALHRFKSRLDQKRVA